MSHYLYVHYILSTYSDDLVSELIVAETYLYMYRIVQVCLTIYI